MPDAPFTNAPNVSKDFTETQPERERKESHVLPKGQTVSLQEKEALENGRTAPVLQPSLTIGGTSETDTHNAESMGREDRIAQIETRLNDRKNQAKKSFNRSR